MSKSAGLGAYAHWVSGCIMIIIGIIGIALVRYIWGSYGKDSGDKKHI